MLPTILLLVLLVMAWVIARIHVRAGFGWFGAVLPFGALTLVFMIFLLQAILDYAVSNTQSTYFMGAMFVVWSLQLLAIAIRRWPALPEKTGEESQS